MMMSRIDAGMSPRRFQRQASTYRLPALRSDAKSAVISNQG
jgi:hypothetical protein